MMVLPIRVRAAKSANEFDRRAGMTESNCSTSWSNACRWLVRRFIALTAGADGPALRIAEPDPSFGRLES